MHSAAEVGDMVQQIEELKKKLLKTLSRIQEPTATLPTHVIETTQPQAVTLQSGSSAIRSTLAFNRPTGSNGHSNGASDTLEKRNQPVTSLSKEEVRSRWLEFVAEVRRQRISLGSVMDSSDVINMEGSVLRIGCGNDFQASSIKRNKELLAEVFQKIFHSKVRLEVEVNLRHVAPSHSGERNNQSSPPVVDQDEHPVIKALMSELGAEPM